MAVAAVVIVALVAGLTTWIVVDANDEASDDAATGDADRVACAIEVPNGAGLAEVGRPSPSFVLRSLDGGCVDLASLGGRPVVINFWASWCNPCREEFPMFRTALDRYGDDGLEILGVIHDDIPSDARRFARQQDANWPLLLDATDATAEAYGIGPLPQTFFVDRDGVVTAHLFGMDRREFTRELRRILAPSAGTPSG